MHRSLTTRLAIATALTLAACSSSPSTIAPASSAVPAASAAPATSPAATDGVTETSAAPFDPAVCRADQLTLQVAAEAYQAETDRPPTDQQQLVDDGLLRETIPGYELKITGDQVEVVAVPGVCG